MTRETVTAKLASIARCIERIRERTPETVADLAADADAQDIISINLQRAVQLAVDLAGVLIADRGLSPPSTMAEAFRTLEAAGLIDSDLSERLARAVGFRNVSVHEYEDIDWEIVFSIATRQVSDFESFAGAVRGLFE